MTVGDIQKVTVDNVCIYRETIDFNFVDIYKGKSSKIPPALLNAQVESVNAMRKYVLDIRIKR